MLGSRSMTCNSIASSVSGRAARLAAGVGSALRSDSTFCGAHAQELFCQPTDIADTHLPIIRRCAQDAENVVRLIQEHVMR